MSDPGVTVSGATGLHVSVVALVREVHAESRPHPADVLERFAVLASTHIAGVANASVMVPGARHGLRASAATGGLPHLIDRIQEETGQGPCFDAVKTRDPIRVDDLPQEGRWPDFTHAVLAQTPVQSMVCYRLYTDIDDWGVLSLHGNAPHAIGADAEEAGLILAAHAALAMNTITRGRQFRSALVSRDIIGQAKGMLMERYEIGAAAAFSLLTRLSQESNKPVVVIAKEIVENKISSTTGTDASLRCSGATPPRRPARPAR